MAPVVVKTPRVIVDVFLLFLVWLPTILFASIGEPFQRGFYCDDESIRYPYKDSTVPNWSLYLIGVALPICGIVIIESFRIFNFEPRLYKRPSGQSAHTFLGKKVHPLLSYLYAYIGYFLFGAALCQGLTDLGKYTIGRLRPHFYQVCKPAIDCTLLPPYHYVEKPNCTTGDTATLMESRLSFPSGHSSFGAYTMFFLVMYIHSRLVWPMVSLLLKHVLQTLCLALGIACALSRISDYKHHWSDVLAGVILGIIVACLTAFHMLGLFRQPHYLFSPPSFLTAPSSDFSFGGDHLHNSDELRLVEQRLRERNISLNRFNQVAPEVVNTDGLQHRNAN